MGFEKGDLVSLDVEWPNGRVTRLSGVKANQILRITEESQ